VGEDVGVGVNVVRIGQGGGDLETTKPGAEALQVRLVLKVITVRMK
jgi:hypothetical protein